jgi:hypothetical protein
LPFLPTAISKRRTVFPSRWTESRRRERSTRIDQRTQSSRALFDSIHATSPLPSSGAWTETQSPRRRTTVESAAVAVVAELLALFNIDADYPYGHALGRVVSRLYECSADLDRLWRITFETIDSLDRSDKVAYFTAKKFLSFQIAKLLDNLQNPQRRTYQSLGYGLGTQAATGPYALFDNVSAIFSALILALIAVVATGVLSSRAAIARGHGLRGRAIVDRTTTVGFVYGGLIFICGAVLEWFGRYGLLTGGDDTIAVSSVTGTARITVRATSMRLVSRRVNRVGDPGVIGAVPHVNGGLARRVRTAIDVAV